MQKVITIICLIIILSCSNDQRADKKDHSISGISTYAVQPLQIDDGEEEGWGADIRISIVQKSENDTVLLYKAVSTYNGQLLGFLFSISKKYENDKGFGQWISLKSLGPESDYFLRILSQLYKQSVDTTTLKFVKSINVSYVNLKKFAKSVTGKEGQNSAADEYKLFFEGHSDQDYAEVFLNVNSVDNWVELKEKDDVYRPILLHFLNQNNSNNSK